jgi:hypothetical protein
MNSIFNNDKHFDFGIISFGFVCSKVEYSINLKLNKIEKIK